MGPDGFKASGISCCVTITPCPSPKEREASLGWELHFLVLGKALWAWAREWKQKSYSWGVPVMVGRARAETCLGGSSACAQREPWLLGEYRNVPVAQEGMFTWVNTSPGGVEVSCVPTQKWLCCVVGMGKAGAAPYGWDRLFWVLFLIF